MLKGLSVNRSRFACAKDALWSPVSEDFNNKQCEFVQKQAAVFKSFAYQYPIKDNKTGVEITLKHTPINCNISHCDLFTEHIPADIKKPLKRDVKAFLATLFENVSDEEMENPFLAQEIEDESDPTQRTQTHFELKLFTTLLLIAIIVIIIAIYC